ncbi:MAG: HDOD domain-containing protein [Armatimonadota bacterium]
MDIKTIIQRASDLPSMPEVAFEVIRIADHPESSALKVANTLSKDPSMSARVLRLANSAFYGMSREVGSVQESVIVLGMRTTKSLSLVAASFPWLHVALKGKGLKPELLWNHCISCAHFSKAIARKVDKSDAEQAFCIALLHDVGTVALYLTLESEFNRLIVKAKTSEVPFDELERIEFGFDHAELGAALAESWNLPKTYSQTIRYHHRPSELETPDTLTDILHVADILVRSRGISEGLDGAFFLKDLGAFERLGFEPEVLEELLSETLNQISESDSEPFARAA